MKRSLGVTVIAVLSLIGSVLTLLLGLLMLLAMAFFPPPTKEFPASPLVLKLMLIFGALVYILPAIWGIVTGIGLLRLRNWGRISIIVFSVFLILISGFTGLAMLLMPVPTPDTAASPAITHTIQVVMGLFWAVLVGIGVWWVVFFTRAGVKRQFLTEGLPVSHPTPEMFAGQLPHPPVVPTTHLAPERPLSFTIIAWFALIGCAFMPLWLILHFPAVLFTRLVTGWVAGLYYGAITAIGLYFGIGILRFKPMARNVGVAYYFFLLVNMAVFYLAPGGRSRVRALMQTQRTMFPWMQSWQGRPEFQVDMTPTVFLGGVMGLVFLVVPLYFLITRKQAFEAATRSR